MPAESERPASDKNESSFSLKDWISLLFSVAALIMSLISFYYSNLRVEDKLLFRVADVRDEGEDARGERTDLMVIASFVNAGNRPAIVMRAGFAADLPGRKPQAWWTDFPNKEFPLLLQPRDVRLVYLKIPVGRFEGVAKVGPEDLSDPNLVTRRVAWLRFRSVDSLGEMHDVQTPAVAVRMTRAEWLKDWRVSDQGKDGVALLGG